MSARPLAAANAARAPRLGFLGVGWIGRHRMQAVLAAGFGDPHVICDPSPDMIDAARLLAPAAEAVATFDELLEATPDGILIATPSALHAEQSIAALSAGVAVFCQKPLGRNAREVSAVLEAARRNDRLLGVDFSYRHTQPPKLIRSLIRENAIGTVYAADLVFHNAYGPDKPWFYDAAQSGGGCVMDLGVHLVDLLLWTLDFPGVNSVSADLFAGGRKLDDQPGQVEDYAVATLGLTAGAVARLACSWRLHAGCDAVISATFHGTDGSLSFRNVAGSFYDFTAELHRGTRSEVITSPPDDWGGRAAVDWAERLAAGVGFDPEAERLLRVSEVLDRIYGSAPESMRAKMLRNL
jgi:predicted dehydrogenase